MNYASHESIVDFNRITIHLEGEPTDIYAAPGIDHATVNPSHIIFLYHGFKGFPRWGYFPHMAQYLASDNTLVYVPRLPTAGVTMDGELDNTEAFSHGTYTQECNFMVNLTKTICLKYPNTPYSLFGFSRGGGMIHPAAYQLSLSPNKPSSVVSWAAISKLKRFSDEAMAEWRESGERPILNTRTGITLPLYTDILDDKGMAGLNPLNALLACTIPTLLMHCKDDQSVPLAEGNELFAALEESPLAKENPSLINRIWLDKGGHTFGARHPLPEQTPTTLRQAIGHTKQWMDYFFNQHQS